MLRRTTPVLIAPLPLYKVVGVIVRQTSRPIVMRAVTVLNQYPTIRRGLVYIGWLHFRASVHMNRMMWSAESQAEKDKAAAEAKKAEKQQEKQRKQQEELQTATAAAAAADSDVTLSAKPEVTGPEAVAQHLSSDKQKPRETAQHARLHPSQAAAVAAAAPPAANQVGFAYARRILPGPLRDYHPLRSVRNIFTPPPRPSDEDLMKKGVELVTEALLFMLISALVLYEMASYSAEHHREEARLESRLKRLEQHMLECPGADAELADAAAAAAAAAASGGDATTTSSAETTTQSGKPVEGATVSGGAEHRHSHGDEDDHTLQRANDDGDLPVVIAPVRHHHHHAAKKSALTIVDLWRNMSVQAKFAVASLFVVPYAVLAAIVVRLFMMMKVR